MEQDVVEKVLGRIDRDELTELVMNLVDIQNNGLDSFKEVRGDGRIRIVCRYRFRRA